MKRVFSLLLALVMIFALVACNNTATEPISETKAGTENPVKEDGTGRVEAEVVSVEAENTSVLRDEINVGITGDITSFFPWQSRGSGGWESAIGGLYQTLLSYYPQDDTYYPCLMKSYTLSEDGMSLSGEIFDYIYDSEGHHITCDDVVFSFEKTYETFNDVRDMAKELVKTGDYTFTLYFNRPLRFGEFLYMTNWTIVSKEAFENSPDEMRTTPVGTGPYKLTSRTEGYSFTYERVDPYWQTDSNYDNPRDRANVNTINWFVITESSQRTIALEQSTIDICSAIDTADLDKFDGKNGTHLYSYSHVLSMTMYPNCNEGKPTNDLNLRKAICYAISNDLILNSVYGGIGSVMYGAGPSWSVNFDPAWENEDNYYHYNVDTAKSYLEKSNYNGEELVIICQSDAKSTNTAQVIQNLLEQINVKTTIASYESSTFSDYVKNPDNWDLMVRTTPAGNSNYLSAVESPMNPASYAWGGSMNFIYDDQLTELLDTALQNGATKDDIQALHECLIENCYMMGLVNTTTVAVVPDYLSDVVLSNRNTIMPGACSYTE